jgi:hypothetical protein
MKNTTNLDAKRRNKQTASKKNVGKKDRIDLMVDILDRYYFRIGGPNLLLSGFEWRHHEEYFRDFHEMVTMFETEEYGRAANAFKRAAKKAEKKVPGLFDELDSAAMHRENVSHDFHTMLGFMLGLRIAGIPTDRAKEMARTWRMGNPRDDA